MKNGRRGAGKAELVAPADFRRYRGDPFRIAADLGTTDSRCLARNSASTAPAALTPIFTVVKKFALRYANLMIRSFGAFSAFLAICPIGLYCAGSVAASPPGETQCSFVLGGPKVVNVSGVDMVQATLQMGTCTLNAHTESTVCLSADGDPSAGQCETQYGAGAAIVYYPYRPGVTYIVKGNGCADVMQGSASPASPSTVCQDVGPKRVAL